jgi:hypothetical protein
MNAIAKGQRGRAPLRNGVVHNQPHAHTHPGGVNAWQQKKGAPRNVFKGRKLAGACTQTAPHRAGFEHWPRQA